MSNKLYEPCPICRSIRPDSLTCRGCAGRGFVEIGLTHNQLERLTRKANALDRVARLVRSLDPAEADQATAWLGGNRSASPRAFFGHALETVSGILDITKDAAGPLAGVRPAPGPGHDERNRWAPFANATEMLLTLADAGRLDLSALPLAREQLEDCRRILAGMNEPAIETPAMEAQP